MVDKKVEWVQLKNKLYKAGHWGADSFWEVALWCHEDKELHLQIGIVRCDDQGSVIDRIPLARSCPLEREEWGLGGLRNIRRELQDRLLETLGTDWDGAKVAAGQIWQNEIIVEKWNKEYVKRNL